MGASTALRAAQQKQRFVWPAYLHQRFEVAELGIDAAKPQAIAKLIDLHGGWEKACLAVFVTRVFSTRAEGWCRGCRV